MGDLVKSFADVTHDNDYLISLSKLTDKKIKDVVGYVSHEFGDPVFKVCWIILDDKDNTMLNVEGEHNMPYIVDSAPNKVLTNIEKTSPDYDGSLDNYEDYDEDEA